MAEFMTEDEFARAVADKLKGAHTKADVDADIVDGSLSEVIDAVLEVLAVHGPVVLGD